MRQLTFSLDESYMNCCINYHEHMYWILCYRILYNISQYVTVNMFYSQLFFLQSKLQSKYAKLRGCGGFSGHICECNSIESDQDQCLRKRTRQLFAADITYTAKLRKHIFVLKETRFESFQLSWMYTD